MESPEHNPAVTEKSNSSLKEDRRRGSSRKRKRTSSERRRYRSRDRNTNPRSSRERHHEDGRRHRKRHSRSRSRSPFTKYRRNERHDKDRRHSRPERNVTDKKPEPVTNTDPNVSESAQPTTHASASEPPRQKTLKMTSGAYIPPAKLRMLRDAITDKTSDEYQRMAWEALKKSIHGLINKVNVGNIGIVVRDLIKENIIRGRGLLCRSLLQAQIASLKFTNVYAALISAINTKFPSIGELLIKRVVLQFRRSMIRNDKQGCISSTTFIAHLLNQKMIHEILVLQILMILTKEPTNDSVEVAINLLKECGERLTETSIKATDLVFDGLRKILHENKLEKRVQYMIEVAFQVRKNKFKDHPAVIDELDVVEEEDQIVHLINVDDKIDADNMLNVYKFDEKYEENENHYKELLNHILGSDVEDSDSDADDEDDDDSDENESNDEEKSDMVIQDETGETMIRFRKNVYLAIQSSLNFQECAHKLLKMQIKPGQEVELCHMILDCCTQQRTYEKFFGSLAETFCRLKREYVEPFCLIFRDSFLTIHRLETNRLRNVAKFYAQLLCSDALPWTILSVIKLNEEDTNASSRIFIKILFQELSEYLSVQSFRDRLFDPSMEEAVTGIFPRNSPKDTRFAINFFTWIGLGYLTEDLRLFLSSTGQKEISLKKENESSSSSSSSSSDSSSSSSSDSNSD